jgi:hypothetical protein
MSANSVNQAQAPIIRLTKNSSLNVEPHGLTAVAPLHTLRRAEPSEAYPPSPRLRRVPTSHSSTGLHPWLSAKEGKLMWRNLGWDKTADQVCSKIDESSATPSNKK